MFIDAEMICRRERSLAVGIAFTTILASSALILTNGFVTPSLPQKQSSSVQTKFAHEKITVAVTREEGKNQKLIDQIVSDHSDLTSKIELLELPCIEHADGSDFGRLAETLSLQRWDYVAVTSPEAARVIASAWDVVRDDPLPVVAVGKATEKVLAEFGIPVVYTPSKATAKVLAKELELKGDGTTVLYPASARAQTTLQDGLAARGFLVTRLNTYDTVTATWTDEQKEASKKVKIACFASPSSIKGWLSNTDGNKDVLVACIGETSATACRGHDWPESQIFYPDSPGLDGWIDSISEAADNVQVAHS